MSVVFETSRSYLPHQDVPLSFSNAALQIRAMQNRIAANYYEPCSRQEDLPYKFMKLTSILQRETAHLSSIHTLSMHPAYQRIIGMGPEVVPYILRQLVSDKGYWFWALKAITGENPIKPNNRGNINAMVQDWLQWGINKGLI